MPKVQKSKSKPLTVFLIQNDVEGNSFWKRHGVAWRNKDDSINFRLDILPGVHFQIRESTNKED